MDLVQLVGAAWLSKSVAVAARVGVADALAAGPLTADELAAALDCHPEPLRRLLLLLCAFGVFARSGADRFANSPLSEQLRADHPSSLRSFCMLAGEEYYAAWGHLLHTVRTGQSAFRHAFGGSVYEHMERHPDAAAVYDAAMRELARPVGELLASGHDFAGAGTVVDVGGGSGVLLERVLRVHGQLVGVCADREDVCRRAERSIPPDLAGRLSFRPTDFFVEVPSGDVYVLKNVLHNWNAASCARILGVVRAAMLRSGGRARLLVVEPLVEPDERSPRALMAALLQMVICEDGARPRTEPQLRAMVSDAGLTTLGVRRLPTGHAVVEAAATA